MKESGKLIELLNEYIEEKELGNTVKEIDDDYFVNNYNNWDGYLCEEVISKKFGFIEWLVDNDKIDFSNIKRIIKDYEVEDKEILEYYDLDFASKEETLIMLLSIQENPISFLLSVLK